MVAQGANPGGRSPHPVPQGGSPLSRAGGRGDGGEGGFSYSRLTPWATLFRPDKSGLTSSTNF